MPKPMTGTPWRAQMRTICCTSSVLCGNTTASGGWLGTQVTVLPCCSRTACEVTRRLPKPAVNSAIAFAIAAGLRCCSAVLVAIAAVPAIGFTPFVAANVAGMAGEVKRRRRPPGDAPGQAFQYMMT